MQKPSLAVLAVLILSLGLLPAYTKEYPQLIKVKEEWLEDNTNRVEISSSDRLPSSILDQLPAQRTGSKTIVTLPTTAVVSPMEIEMKVGERNSGKRVIDAGVTLKYEKEPYLVRVYLESSEPFEITQINEFLPMDKLPKKVQLKGQLNGEKYTLTLEKTSPQKKAFNFSISAGANVSCSITGWFADYQPNITIEQPNVSVEYEAAVKKSFRF